MPAKRVDAPVTPKSFSEIKIDPTVLEQYTGSYDLAPGAQFKIRVQKGQLMVRLASQPWLPIFPFDSDRFFYKVVDAQITFNREDDKIVSLNLHQNGANQLAKKR